MTNKRVALVTGGNRGIGYEICRQLALTGVEVVLGARDLAKAENAAGQLVKEGLSVVPRELDVRSEVSVPGFSSLRSWEVASSLSFAPSNQRFHKPAQ
jgi:NAD(P)-dependent dehydrogenase (short-subunit alcohol dehydrogenase family)